MDKLRDALNPGHEKDDAVLYQTTGASDSRSKENTPAPAETNLTPTESPQSDSKTKSSGGLKSKIDSLKSKFSSNKDKDAQHSKEQSVSSSSSPPLGSKTSSDVPVAAATNASVDQQRSTPTSTDATLNPSTYQSGGSNTLPIHSKTAASGAGVGALGAAGIASHDNATREQPASASSYSPIHRNIPTSTATHWTGEQTTSASSFSPIHRNITPSAPTQSAVDSTRHQIPTTPGANEPIVPTTTTNPTQSGIEDHTTRNTALGAAGLAGGAYAGSKALGPHDSQSVQPGQAITTDSAVPQSSVSQTAGSQTPTEGAGVAYSSGPYTARSFALAPVQEPPKESGYPSPAGNTFGNYGTTAPLRGDGIVPETSTTSDSTLAGGIGSGDSNTRGTLSRLDSEPLPMPGSFPEPTPLSEEPQSSFPTRSDIGVGPGAAAAAATAASGIAGSRNTSNPIETTSHAHPTASGISGSRDTHSPAETTSQTHPPASGIASSRDASRPTDTTSHAHAAASTEPLSQPDREHHHIRDAAVAGGSGVAAIAAAEAYRRHESGETSNIQRGAPTVESIAKSDTSNLTPNQQIYGTQAVGGVDAIGTGQKSSVPSTSATSTGDNASSNLTPNQQIYGTTNVGGVESVSQSAPTSTSVGGPNPDGQAVPNSTTSESSKLSPNQKIYGTTNVGGVDSVQGAPTSTTSESSKLSPSQQIYGTSAVGGPEVVNRNTADPQEDLTKRNAALAGAGVLGAGGAGAYFASTLRDDDTSTRTGPTSASAYDSQGAAPPTTTAHHSTAQDTGSTGAFHGKEKEHHHGRDTALAGGATGVAGAGAYGLPTSDTETAIPSSTSQSTYPTQSSPHGTQVPTQSGDKSSHHGRDAAIAGGALGATGAGAYALGGRDDDRAVSSSAQQTTQPSQTGAYGAHESTGVQDQSRDHHHGRDSALAGGVVGTGAGAHALGRSDNDHAVPSTTQHATSAGQGVSHGVHDQAQDPATQVRDDDHHTKEKLAVGGLGAGAVAGAGAYGLHQSKERDAAEKVALEKQAMDQQRESEHAAKQAEKDAKEAKKEHAKEEKHAEKAAHKEHAKEEKKAEKHAHKEQEKHEKELEKQREKQEKEAEKERKKAEKDAEKEKKGGLLGFLHRDKDKHPEQEETEEQRRHGEAAAGGAAAVGGAGAGAGAYAAYNAHSQDKTTSQDPGLPESRRGVNDGLARDESQTSQYSRGSQEIPVRTDSPGSEKKSRGLGALFHRKDKSRSSVDEDRSSPVAGESSVHGTPDRTSSGGAYATHEGRNKLHKDPPKDYYEKHGVTPPQRSSIEQGPISGIHEPDSIPRDTTDQFRGAPIGNTPQTVTEPVTGLPMKVGGEYGVGAGGTDANANIPGYRAPQ